MKILAKAGIEDVAIVYIAEMDDGKLVEFVESVQPPIPREQKWVLIVSTLYGCPVGCRFCDAGEYYRGKLSMEEILSQIDYPIAHRFPGRTIPIPKFKIQFARMGDPAFNTHVLDILEELPKIYDAPGLLPTISTIAPKGTDAFFDKLIRIKDMLYQERFVLQFSIHTTNTKLAQWLMPVRRWSFEHIAEYGEAFYKKGERKITLNFALAEGMPVEPDVLLRHFSTEKFLIKMTPVNPTYQANKNDISSHILPEKETYDIIDTLKEVGYEVILSIGELKENYIGSNCGQYISNYLRKQEAIEDSYTFPLQTV